MVLVERRGLGFALVAVLLRGPLCYCALDSALHRRLRLGDGLGGAAAGGASVGLGFRIA